MLHSNIVTVLQVSVPLTACGLMARLPVMGAVSIWELQPQTKLFRHFNTIFNFAPWYHCVQKKQICPPPHPWCNVVDLL